MSDSTWWAAKVQPEIPVLPPTDGVAYRDSNRSRGLPGALSEQWVNAHNGSNRGPIHANIYSDEAAKSIFSGDYLRQPVQHPQLPRDGESDTTFEARVRGSLNGLRADAEVGKIDADTYNAIITAYNEAIARIDSGEARQGTRREGDGVGIMGEAPTLRGMQGAVSYRDLAANAAQSAHAVVATGRQADEAQRIASATVRRSGYEPVAGADAATVRQTTRQYAGNQGLFR